MARLYKQKCQNAFSSSTSKLKIAKLEALTGNADNHRSYEAKIIIYFMTNESYLILKVSIDRTSII